MSGNLTITHIYKDTNKIEVHYIFDGNWGKFLKDNKITNRYDEDVKNVPDSIAIIPALCNLLPIAWVYNLNISCNEIDDEFNKSLPKILDGYKKMYPKITFDGTINAKKIITNRYEAKKFGVLFSGGVDATTTAFRHMPKGPDIITVLGSDVKLTDTKGIENVNTLNEGFSKAHNLKYERIYSTFKLFLNEDALQDADFMVKNKYGWWHEFQHGIGLIGLAAPIAYTRGYKTVYIASSFNEKMKGHYTCASDPSIDNKLKYGNTDTCHDGYELNRQEKVKFICDYSKKNNLTTFIRVCWESSGGRNCCHCEKCCRTYLAFLTEKVDPSIVGLKFNEEQRRNMIKMYKKKLPYNFFKNQLGEYKDIQRRFIENYTEEETPEDLKWFRSIKIGKKEVPFYYKIKPAIKRLLRK